MDEVLAMSPEMREKLSQAAGPWDERCCVVYWRPLGSEVHCNLKKGHTGSHGLIHMLPSNG